MPGKGRRVAVRQAELRVRRRRPGQPPGANAGPVGTMAVEGQDGSAPAPEGRQPAAAGPAVTTPARPAASPQRTSGPRARDRSYVALAYSHVGAEMRRIFIVTGVVLAILVALTIVLPKVT